MPNGADMMGFQVGSFVVVGMHSGGHERSWVCKCTLCGAESIKSTAVLRRKSTITCRGCYLPVVEIKGSLAKVYLKGTTVATIDASDAQIITKYKTWYREHKGYLAHRDPDAGVIVKLHRAVCGANPGEIVDHIDGDVTNNRRCNLRIVSAVQSSQNRKLKNTNSSGVTGVVFSKYHSLWEARIKVNKKYKLLGRFVDKNAAIEARKVAEEIYFGEYRRA